MGHQSWQSKQILDLLRPRLCFLWVNIVNHCSSGYPGLERIYILSLRHYFACRGMKPIMNFFFQIGLFSLDQREVKGKNKFQPRKKKLIKGFSFLCRSQISCLRRQIHFFTQLPHVQPSDLKWLTYFNIPLILSLWKFPGVPLKIASWRPAIFQILNWIFSLKRKSTENSKP